jgi:hypothetical protein
MAQVNEAEQEMNKEHQRPCSAEVLSQKIEYSPPRAEKEVHPEEDHAQTETDEPSLYKSHLLGKAEPFTEESPVHGLKTCEEDGGGIEKNPS